MFEKYDLISQILQPVRESEEVPEDIKQILDSPQIADAVTQQLQHIITLPDEFFLNEFQMPNTPETRQAIKDFKKDLKKDLEG